MNVETIFLQAVALPPEDRAAFLAEACAGRPKIREAVEVLLAARERSRTLIDTPGSETAGADTHDFEAPPAPDGSGEAGPTLTEGPPGRGHD